MLVGGIDISQKKKAFVRGKGVEMVNWRTGEFVMFDGAIWQGRGANFLYHYPGHQQSRTLNSKRDKVENIKKKVFSSCSIMFLEHHF